MKIEKYLYVFLGIIVLILASVWVRESVHVENQTIKNPEEKVKVVATYEQINQQKTIKKLIEKYNEEAEVEAEIILSLIHISVIITGAIKDILGSLDCVDRFIRVFGLVNCDNGFSDIDKVMDGFSDTIMQIFEERGYHTRTAMGTRNLPNGNIPVEIEAVIKIRE